MIHRSVYTLGVLVTLLTELSDACGQVSAIPTNIRASYTMESLSDASGVSRNEILYGVSAPPGRVIGDTYLSTYWRESAIQLYKDDRVLQGYQVRYDIHSDVLDIKTDNGVKVLDGRRIRSFSWLDSSKLDPVFFVNARDYKLGNVPMTGFFEVLVDGATPLFKRTQLRVKKANYNVALDVGSRDDKILKEHTYFAGQQKNVVELNGAKKKVLSVFGNKSADVEKYIDENNLSLKKQSDIVKIFEYYNALLMQ